MMPRHIHINIHTYVRPKYILKWVCEFNSLGSIYIHRVVFFWHFFSLHTNGKWCSKKGSHPCYFQSQFVYVLSLSLQGFVWPEYHFWLFFGAHMKTEMDVVIFMYLKHSPDNMIPIIYQFMGLTTLVQAFLLKYHF